MPVFANLPISRKLMIAFAAVLAIICVSSAIIYERLRVIEEAKNWRIHTSDVLETLGLAMDAIQDQEAGVRHYFITGSKQDLENYYRATDAFTAGLRKVKELSADNPAQQSRLDELNELANKWRSDIAEREIALLATRETREDARALEWSPAARSAMDLIRAKFDEIAGVERDLLAKREAAQNQAFTTAYNLTMLGGAASLGVAILMGILLTYGITRPIIRMTGAMAALAKGDTNIDVPDVGRGDQIGAMAAAVQVFKENIIERQKAEAELVHREAKIRRLVDANIIGIFVFDCEGRIVEANDAFLKMVGYDREDLVSGDLSWPNLTPPEWRDRLAQAWAELRRTGAVQPYEREYLHKDGSRVPAMIGSARIDESGEGVAFVLDLRDRKRAEEALRDSEERFRTLMQFSFDVYWETDAQHRFIRQEFSEGLADAPAPGSEIGKTRWEVPYLEPDAETWRKHRETMDAHLPFRDFELARPTPDGKKRYVSVSGLPVFDKSGRFVGYRGVGRHITDRKRTEEALRESEERFRTLVQFSFDVYWETDAEHRFIRQEFAETLAGASVPGSEIGNARSEIPALLGKKGWELPYSGPDAEAWRTHCEKLDTHLPFRDFEIARPLPDGSKRYISVSALPLFDAAGRFKGYRGVGRDITERKRAEQALRESEEKWRAVFENNPTMYFMVDAAGTVLSVNPFGAEQLGYTIDELTGGSVLKVFHEADRAAALWNTTRCLERVGEAFSWELRKIRKDGSMLWVRETGRAMLMQDRPVVLIVCEDITQRKQAEYLTGQVFETAPDGICIVGRNYRYRRANPVYARRWGAPAEQIIGMHVSELLGAGPFEKIIKANLDRCFAGEEVAFEWIAESRGGLHLAVSYSPLRSGSEEVEAVLVIQRDVTELMRASEALRAAQAELAHVNRVTTMGQMTASIAHEINQPIAATVTNAQAALRWLCAQPPDLGEVRDALARIVNDGNRAGDVIVRIRDLIKKSPPRKDRFDLNQAVLDVLTLTRTEVLSHGVSLEVQLAPGLPAVEGDRTQLQQVIMNLVLNAIDAMSMSDGGGPRELRISTDTDAGGGPFVAVRDSGPGLDPADLDRVFEAFYTTKPNGMGMGLAICRSIVEAHGGHMWVAANEPRGAVFQFTLPES